MKSLENKVALVTGAGGYIGRAIAVKLAAEGAAVAVTDINSDVAERTLADITGAGSQAASFVADFSDRIQIAAMVAGALERFGHIDILVNVAGGSARKDCSRFAVAPDEIIDRIIDINLKGPLFCTKAVLGSMIERGCGKIVNIGSITGVQGLENVVDYSAAKGGVIAFTKALAKELGPSGINVNCVSPGLVPRPEENTDRAARGNYLGKICTGEDVAELVAFLCSDAAGFITGQNYIIDGGRSLAMKGD